jgi:D-alanyl-D-alanine endopeptidase (penicillin-binding protein 7)
MSNRKSLAKLLLLLAFLVFFSANTLYLFEIDTSEVKATVHKSCEFSFDKKTSKGPHLNLKSAFLADFETGDVLYSKNSNKVRPIASISKLVAAMVIADKRVDLKKTAKITKSDAYRSSRSRLSVGFELTLYDLLHAGLMNSDNRAMRALARATSGSIKAFAGDMNKKVKRLGLEHTVFFEPTGLDKRNVSTAQEVAKIVFYAYKYDLIAEITAKKRYRVKIVNRKNTFRPMANTNLLTQSPYKVLAGKTGYIRAADYCLATLVKNKKGEKLLAVVLGVPGDKLRFKEARRLIDWGFKQI